LGAEISLPISVKFSSARCTGAASVQRRETIKKLQKEDQVSGKYILSAAATRRTSLWGES